MKILALDLETIADADVGHRVFGCSGTDAEVRAAMRAKRLQDTDGKSDFHKPAFWQIVAVGLVGINTTGNVVKLAAASLEDGATERSLLALVGAWLERKPNPLVSWNGNSFDLPVLRYRALLHGINLGSLYGPPEQKSYQSYLYRYSESHIDLMDVLGGYGASTPLKLAEAARLCGLPAKTAADGSGVEALVEAEDWPTLRSYVQEDALITALLYLRFELTRGRITSREFQELLERLMGELGTDHFAVGQAIAGWRTEPLALALA